MANPLQIVTLGDSITQATSGRNSYRRDLWNQLIDRGYSVDFVGSENQTQDGRNFPDGSFDPDHEGHWGWRTDEIVNGRSGQGNLADWLQGYTPDMALIHLGSNDVLQNNSATSTINELKQTIAILRQDNPNVVVFIAQLIPMGNSRNQGVDALNAQLPSLVDEESRLDSPVILVDQNSGFNANTDTYDGVHPNESGEAKMAQRWFEAIDRYFDGSQPPVLPEWVANRDQIMTFQGSAVDIDVLANDTTTATTSFTLSIEDGSSSGSLTLDLNGTPSDASDDFITYQPNENFTGLDRFTYSIDDGQGNRSSAEVVIAVNPVVEPGDRVQAGLLSLYNFNEGSGNMVRDVSGVGTALDLTINNFSDVSWGDGILTLNGPSLVSSEQAASKLNRGIAQTQEITIEAWITPANRSQQGPARIATLSSNSTHRNFTLGQQGSDYNVRLRTTQTGKNGFGEMVSSTGDQLTAELTHVVYSREADGDAFLFIDNQLVSSATIGGSLANWNDSYQFALGDEFGGGRAWLGSYDQLAIYNQAFDAQEVAQNFLAGLDGTETSPPLPPVNQAPNAADDQATTAEATAVTIDVLANDSDPDSDVLSLQSVSSPVNGSAEILNNQVVYTPDAGFSGTDSFTYRIGDSKGGTATATVGLEVMPAVAPPPSPPPSPTPSDRIREGLLSLYTFDEGSGSVVRDVSGVGEAMDLQIDKLTGIGWGDGVLNVTASSLIASDQAADKLINGITQTEEITIEAWITPANRSQQGHAHIATLSGNTLNRNFTLGQQGSDYNVHLRTTQTSQNGFDKTVSSTDGQLTAELTHVVYSREADGDAFLFIDNQLVSSTIMGGSLANWNDSYRFALGDEFGGGRAWLGSYDLVAVYNQAFDARDVEHNFLAGSASSTLI